jgi:uncharacterized protein (DUF1800 family)
LSAVWWSRPIHCGAGSLKIALDNLYNHPSTAPFIARQFIQRFVTSKLEPWLYLPRRRRSLAGGGKRGDFKDYRAVLLDPEARQPASRKAMPTEN